MPLKPRAWGYRSRESDRAVAVHYRTRALLCNAVSTMRLHGWTVIFQPSLFHPCTDDGGERSMNFSSADVNIWKRNMMWTWNLEQIQSLITRIMTLEQRIYHISTVVRVFPLCLSRILRQWYEPGCKSSTISTGNWPFSEELITGIWNTTVKPAGSRCKLCRDTWFPTSSFQQGVNNGTISMSFSEAKPVYNFHQVSVRW